MIRRTSTAGLASPDCDLLPLPPALQHLEFAPIPGYEGRYAISKTGLVRTFVGSGRCPAGGILAASLWTISGDDYVCVTLTNIHGKSRRWQVHRLVLMTFVGPPPSHVHQGNHKNGQKWDNRLTNLE